MPIFSKDDEQYDESGMVAGMEQDFERVIAEKDAYITKLENDLDYANSEIVRLTGLLRGNIYSVVSNMFKV